MRRLPNHSSPWKTLPTRNETVRRERRQDAMQCLLPSAGCGILDIRDADMLITGLQRQKTRLLRKRNERRWMDCMRPSFDFETIEPKTGRTVGGEEAEASPKYCSSLCMCIWAQSTFSECLRACVGAEEGEEEEIWNVVDIQNPMARTYYGWLAEIKDRMMSVGKRRNPSVPSCPALFMRAICGREMELPSVFRVQEAKTNGTLSALVCIPWNSLQPRKGKMLQESS